MQRRVHPGALAIFAGIAALLLGIAAPAQAWHHHHHHSSHKAAWGVATAGSAAATGYAIAHGNPGWSLVGAGATYLSYNKWQHSGHHHHHYSHHHHYHHHH